MLLQIDSNHHDWLKDRGPKLVLVAAIADANNEVSFLIFREQEAAAGNFLQLRRSVAPID